MLVDSKDTSVQVYEEPGKLELKSQFIELRSKGYSFQKIARRLKVSKSTLANWSAELEGEISSLRAMELEALYERYYLAREGKVKLLGEQLKAIQAELKTRKLDSLSTEKLIELELKILEALKEEYIETRPLSDQEIQELRC